MIIYIRFGILANKSKRLELEVGVGECESERREIYINIRFLNAREQSKRLELEVKSVGETEAVGANKFWHKINRAPIK